MHPIERRWNGTGPRFEIPWGGRTWALQVDDLRPGLRAPGVNGGPLLALEGVAETGRWAADALSGATLVGAGLHFQRVEATYAPTEWGGLVVRAAWSPADVDGMDLEVQVQAQSVGRLRSIEVRLISEFAEPHPSPWKHQRWVEPRDAHAASLSYDGRESDLKGLTTLPPRLAAFYSPRLVTGVGDEGWLYAEMVHPDDVCRRIREGGRSLAQARTTRYGLFGHDLEKGVVLRGRLRALWLHSETAKEEALAQFESFLREPLPLST